MREKVAPFGANIRPYMPDEHRAFFESLTYLIAGSVDEEGLVWASMLTGPAGFAASPDATRLSIGAVPGPNDPGRGGFRLGAAIGLLGIELHTRRRNRANGRVCDLRPGQGFDLEVLQSFGNCPQYINARAAAAAPIAERAPQAEVVVSEELDRASMSVLASADTFFVATTSGSHGDGAQRGADVSHRGGWPGFVKIIDSKTLIWPDYRGNFFFNTLGNLHLDPRCGLLVIDFAGGDLLHLTGSAGVLWDWDRDDPAFVGAQRVIRFDLKRAVRTAGASPFAWTFLGPARQFAAP
ncbi:MAG: pyridoxamine 5'-phosphate oxidase family protein [Caulobacteraceae bacterium]